MESIPEPALEEIKGVGTHRSLPCVELLLLSPRGHEHQHGSLHDAWNEFNSGGPWHPLTLKGHDRHGACVPGKPSHGKLASWQTWHSHASSSRGGERLKSADQGDVNAESVAGGQRQKPGRQYLG